MAKPRSIYACTHCGAQQPRWLGRCPECASWDTLVEEPTGSPPPASERGDLLAREGSRGAEKPQSLGDIDAAAQPRVATGVSELDRVLGGGLVPGSVVLMGGEPGVGKSTLALQLAASVAAPSHERPRGSRVLYISGEESPQQIRLRADRLNEDADGIQVLAETRVESLVDPWRELEPELVIVDSIQTLQTQRVESAPGSIAQVRECAAMLAATAKTRGTALVLIGHVTKEGGLAGPRVLEHLVDVVLAFEGERAHAFRLLRAVKNRFGSTQEVGVFTMSGEGLVAVENPSELFLAERSDGAQGSCIVPLLEGTRPMLVEIQALVAPSPYGTPRRTTMGVEDGRVALLLAVLDRCSSVDLVSRDVFVNVAGGVRVGEPGADLALALAIASSAIDCAVPSDAAACGEVGLGGEVRRITRIDLRIREAARLGFRTILVPPRVTDAVSVPDGCRLVSVERIGDAVDWLRRCEDDR